MARAAFPLPQGFAGKGEFSLSSLWWIKTLWFFWASSGAIWNGISFETVVIPAFAGMTAAGGARVSQMTRLPLGFHS